MTATRGKLIAIEGVDGAGTTTQAELLEQRLGLYRTREPSDREIGKLIRRYLRGELGLANEVSIALLFAADRVDHYTYEIQEQLEKGRSVVTDRYLLSSLVYQSMNVDRAFVALINQNAKEADLTILVDVTAETAAERRRKRGGAEERYDHEATQRRLVEAYRREIALVPKSKVVDGNGPAEAVYAEIARAVQSCLDGAGGASS